jgi:hypothetical protein
MVESYDPTGVIPPRWNFYGGIIGRNRNNSTEVTYHGRII